VTSLARGQNVFVRCSLDIESSRQEDCEVCVLMGRRDDNT